MVAGLVVEFQPIMPQNHKFRQNQKNFGNEAAFESAG